MFTVVVNWVHFVPQTGSHGQARGGTVKGLSGDGNNSEKDIFPAHPGDSHMLTWSLPPFLATETTARGHGVVPHCWGPHQRLDFPPGQEGPSLPSGRADFQGAA